MLFDSPLAYCCLSYNMSALRLFIGITVLTGCNALLLPRVAQRIWSEGEVVKYMTSHPSRAYFSRLFRDGGFRVGMEVGVADGRFSEHFLKDNSGIGEFTWHMVEPFPNTALVSRYPPAGEGGNIGIGFDPADKPWAERNIGNNANKVFHRAFSNNKSFLNTILVESLDFVYLDGAHDYPYVKGELEDIWSKVRIGGIIAGHDYCDHGEKEGVAFKQCQGCSDVPRCVGYTDYGIKIGHKSPTGIALSQHGVVQSVHEFLEKHPTTELRHTLENFTQESLSADGLDYDLIITNTYNPSWYFVKTVGVR